MFNLFGQSKAQIMMINNHEMQLYIWKNKSLTFIRAFTEDPADLEQFAGAIKKDAKSPVIIITNFIEESFLNETAAHTSGGDRKALLDRKLGYAFRTTPYRTAKVIDREKDGRRDDKILMSALTKTDLLKPWITPLLERQIAIQSITSSAYLTESFVQSVEEKQEEHLLIISLEDETELRQTYLKKGRIIFSRLTTLPSQDLTVVADNIYKESRQIRSYLERIQALPYDGILKIQIYSPFSANELIIDRDTSSLNSFESYDTHIKAQEFSVEINNITPSALALFLAHTLQKKATQNVYAPFNIRRFFTLNTIARSLKWSSACLIIVLLFLKIPTLLNSIDNWKQQEQIANQTRPLVIEYDVLTERFPETPIPSSEMALVVQTFEQIKQQSYTPTEALSIISESLLSSPGLKITALNWKLSEATSLTGNQGYGARASSTTATQFQQAILDHRSILKVKIDGLAFSPNSYREAQNQVLAFITALDEYPTVSVTPLKMPTEIRVDSLIRTTIDGDELQGEFSLELTIESPQEEQII